MKEKKVVSMVVRLAIEGIGLARPEIIAAEHELRSLGRRGDPVQIPMSQPARDAFYGIAVRFASERLAHLRGEIVDVRTMEVHVGSGPGYLILCRLGGEAAVAVVSRVDEEDPDDGGTILELVV